MNISNKIIGNIIGRDRVSKNYGKLSQSAKELEKQSRKYSPITEINIPVALEDKHPDDLTAEERKFLIQQYGKVPRE